MVAAWLFVLFMGTEQTLVVVEPEWITVVPVVPAGQFQLKGGVANRSTVTVVTVPLWVIVNTWAELPLGDNATCALPSTYMPPPVITFGPVELLYARYTPDDAPEEGYAVPEIFFKAALRSAFVGFAVFVPKPSSTARFWL